MMKTVLALAGVIVTFCCPGHNNRKETAEAWNTDGAAEIQQPDTVWQIPDSLLLKLSETVPEFHPKSPSVPESVTFAGQTVNLDTDDLYERMDRELIAFTYMHSNSTLMLKRSKRIFSLIVPILKKNGVPDDLKYLMAIESNLDPKAVSVTGASGLWQFTKATAGDYGLEVNAEVDERFNIEKSTAAACRFLKRAYARYGDWMTVAASYNAGQGGISKRLEEQGESSAMNIVVREETARYMFRVLTAKLFFEDPAAFGFDIDEDEYYPVREPSKIVTTSEPIPDLVEFAKENGISYRALKEANPWLVGTKLTNAKGNTYKIIISYKGRR